MPIKTPMPCGVAVFAALALAGGAAAQESAPARAEWTGAPEFKLGDWTVKPRGRIYLDHVHQEVDGGAFVPDRSNDNGRLRTARLGVEGDWRDRFSFLVEASFVDGETDWEDISFAFAPTDAVAVSIGNMKTVSLENLTSDNYVTFIERGPFNDVLDIGRALTLKANAHGDNWSLAAAISGEDVNDTDFRDQQTRTVSARATYAPVASDAFSVHLGAWVRSRQRGEEGFLRYRARPNTNYGARYVDTGSIGESDAVVALEAAAVRGSVSAQAEWAVVRIDPVSIGGDAEIDTGYAFVSWFLTGETRPYDPEAGVFKRVRVGRSVPQGGPGAVELAVRYDRADLGGAYRQPALPSALAGRSDAVTLAANWHVFSRLRFMANYTMSRNDNPGAPFDADVNTFQLRAQFDF